MLWAHDSTLQVPHLIGLVGRVDFPIDEPLSQPHLAKAALAKAPLYDVDRHAWQLHL